MAVKLRLTRMGRKKRPFYRIVAVDSRRRRDGAYLDRIGHYDPIKRPAEVVIDVEKAIQWLKQGAKPSDTVRTIFSREGIMLRWDMMKRDYDAEKIEEAVSKHREHRYGKLAKETPEVKKEEPVEVEEPVAEEPKKAKKTEEKPAKAEEPAKEGKKTEASDEKPADEKPAEKKPAEEKPAEEKPADEKPAAEKAAKDKAAEDKTADAAAEEKKDAGDKEKAE